MSLWVTMAVLLIGALAFVVLPLYRDTQRLTALLASVILFVVSLSVGLYYQIGSPDVPSGRTEVPSPEAMVESLAARLQANPEDVEGWLMLARSYEQLERFAEAAEAYEQILILQPNHPTALFYGGYIAASRGDTALAAQRWESILAANAAPDDVRESMQRQIALWRGEMTVTDPGAVTAEQPQAIVVASLDVSDEARASLPGNAVIYLIARDPQQPSPPIAVARRPLSELPDTISLGDRDSMVPGRNLSAFPVYELVARASASGAPIAQPGDWYTSQVIDQFETQTVELLIDVQVE